MSSNFSFGLVAFSLDVDSTSVEPSSLTHTICMILLYHPQPSSKIRERVFFEDIQDSYFPRKRVILVLTSVNFERKGLI